MNDKELNYEKPVVRIINPLQVYKYMKQGVSPISLYPDTTTEKVVFVFYKDETQELYRQWLNREI